MLFDLLKTLMALLVPASSSNLAGDPPPPDPK